MAVTCVIDADVDAGVDSVHVVFDGGNCVFLRGDWQPDALVGLEVETVSIAVRLEARVERIPIPEFGVACVITGVIVVVVPVSVGVLVIVTEVFCVSTISPIVFVGIARTGSCFKYACCCCWPRFIPVQPY